MAVIRRNPNKNKPAQSNIASPPIRKVQNMESGAIKNMEALIAARMVEGGSYIYVDDGPDESKSLPRRKKFLAASTKESDVINLAKIPQLDVTGEGDIYTGPQRNIVRSDSPEDLDTSVSTLPPNPNRKIRKKSDFPKEKLDYIIKTNTANPASVESTRSAGDLKSIIDKVRSERKK